MQTISIFWERVHYNELPHVDDAHFYAFTISKNVIYIGQAYHQMVDAEIKNTKRAFDFKLQGLSIWLGRIDERSPKRVTKQLIHDIESLLIYMNQPSSNTHCMKNYTGRDNLKIISHDIPFIHKEIICKESEFYFSD